MSHESEPYNPSEPRPPLGDGEIYTKEQLDAMGMGARALFEWAKTHSKEEQQELLGLLPQSDEANVDSGVKYEGKRVLDYNIISQRSIVERVFDEANDPNTALKKERNEALLNRLHAREPEAIRTLHESPNYGNILKLKELKLTLQEEPPVSGTSTSALLRALQKDSKIYNYVLEATVNDGWSTDDPDVIEAAIAWITPLIESELSGRTDPARFVERTDNSTFVPTTF